VVATAMILAAAEIVGRPHINSNEKAR